MKKFYTIFLLSIVFLICGSIVFRYYYYPLKYEDEIVYCSKKYDVDPGLVASVIRVESSFDPYTVSNKNAKGLMQLLTTTADDMAQRLNIVEYDIFDVKTNIELGTYYLSYLFEIFDDQNTVLASYNAGLGNVKNWLADTRYSTDGKTLKVIPFSETKEYVKKVNKFFEYYKLQF